MAAVLCSDIQIYLSLFRLLQWQHNNEFDATVLEN
jgi:hypothetical protein